MKLFSVTKNITITEETCCACAQPFGLGFKEYYRESGRSFYCPYCGTSQHYPGKKKLDQIKELERQLSIKAEEARRAKQDAEHFEASRNAYKGQITKMKHRLAHGVCPCCNRHFNNLERHITRQHPEFKEETK